MAAFPLKISAVWRINLADSTSAWAFKIFDSMLMKCITCKSFLFGYCSQSILKLLVQNNIFNQYICNLNTPLMNLSCNKFTQL